VKIPNGVRDPYLVGGPLAEWITRFCCNGAICIRAAPELQCLILRAEAVRQKLEPTLFRGRTEMKVAFRIAAVLGRGTCSAPASSSKTFVAHT
jgi:hypothetical protein